VSTEEFTDGHIVGHIIIDSAPGAGARRHENPLFGQDRGSLLYVSLSGRRGSGLYLPRLAYTDLTQTEPRLSGGVAMANRKGLHFVALAEAL